MEVLGILEVIVHAGRKFKTTDWFSKADPYCALFIDEKDRQQTKVIDNTEDPVWEETFTFNVYPEKQRHVLTIVAYDKDLFKSDKLGEIFFDLSPIIQNGVTFRDWIPLRDQSGEVNNKGELEISVQFLAPPNYAGVPQRYLRTETGGWRCEARGESGWVCVPTTRISTRR